MNFNFDESSREWRKNKINVGKGYFQYKCSVEGCKDILYRYTTQSKYFDTFATEFDLLHRNHPNQEIYCEEHLLNNYNNKLNNNNK